jgi:hypothetical protein
VMCWWWCMATKPREEEEEEGEINLVFSYSRWLRELYSVRLLISRH